MTTPPHPPHTPDPAALASAALASADYLRQRTSPQPEDQFYLHLLDLLAALKTALPSDPQKTLDFGAGGSPYRSLFPTATYLRADLPDATSIDFPITPDGSLPPSIPTDFDLVLSSQVLEHVTDPQHYLLQAHRILRPGGTLILSTHGTFPDHPCPLDLWRWTASGLRHQLESAGFTVHSVTKLTHGFRAAWFLFDQSLLALPCPTLTRRLLRRIHLTLRPTLNRLVNHLTPSQAQVPESHPPSGLDLTIGLFALATKP
jgi:SAM-dependent methyltransferase